MSGEGTRGVAPVIGFLLVFTIGLLSFAGYQAFVVPDHNAEVEFDHSLRVQSDMQDLRAAFVGAPSYANETRSVTIELGLAYPGRAIAVNAGPPSGSLRTADEGTLSASGVDVSDLCGIDGAVTDRTVSYRPAYNYLDPAPTFGYDNSVSYRSYDGDYVVDSGQALLRGDTVLFRPLTTPISVSESGTGSIDIESFPRNTTSATGPLTITLTTRLPPEKWETLLEGESRFDSITVTEPKTGPDDTATIDIHLVSGTYTVGCQTFGAGRQPDASSPPANSSGDGESTINPAAPGDIALVDTRYVSNSTVEIDLKNTGDSSQTFEVARVPFYDGGQNNNYPDYTILNGNDRIDIGDDMKTVTTVTIDPGESETVTFAFYEERMNRDRQLTGLSGDFFIFVTRYQPSNVKATYFVNIPSTQPGGP